MGDEEASPEIIRTCKKEDLLKEHRERYENYTKRFA